LHAFSIIASLSTVLHTLSLHDALPISSSGRSSRRQCSLHSSCSCPRAAKPCPLASRERTGCVSCLTPRVCSRCLCPARTSPWREDRKSTRLNSSHVQISYAVFCLKKKT